jgi:hypothetical protein
MEYNLNDNINILYNYCYNKNNTNCLNYENIELGSININNIKLSIEHNKHNIIFRQVIIGKFKTMMMNNDIYYYKEYSHDFPITFKISFYNEQNEIYDLSSKINNDSLFSYLLSSLILSNKTKHILLPIINIDINYNDIQFIFDENTKYKLKNKIKLNEIQSICCLQIREHYFKQILLNEYLKSNSCDYKVLLFQIIHTLAVIQNEYPTFRHNNLILNNILIYCKNKSDIIYSYNGFQNDVFNIPNNGFDIKICNFENSTINKFYGNSIYNPYYDIYIFFTDLMKNIKCNNDINTFINKYIPDKFNENEILIKPIDLLYDEFFSEFNTKITGNKETKLTGNKETKLTGNKKLYISMDSDNYSILGKQNKLISKTNIIMGKRIIKTDFINTEISEISEMSEVNSVNKRYLKSKKLLGGASEINSSTIKNNPFITKDNKEIYRKRQEENPIREPPILIDQKVYAPQQQQYKPQAPPPAFIPIFNEDNTLNDKILPYPFTNVMTQQPVQKNYTLNLPSVLGSYTAINRIYEDVLPPQYQYAATTINQRIQLINYLKNSMIKHRNGEELIQKTHSHTENTLLSYIKILKFNPYTSKQNIYTDLPINFLVFNAGYPIRVNPKNNGIELGKEAMGINIRIYLLTINDYRYKHYEDTNDPRIKKIESDVWRELKYYDYIQTKILEQKISPNFIAPILYKIDTSNKIDWKNSIKNKEKEIKSGGIEYLLEIKKGGNQNMKMDLPELPDIELTDKDKDSGRNLILVTEAPTNSLLQWSSKIYEKNGTVYKQISSGFHSEEVWKSILFQIMYIFKVLEKHKICFSSISIENNFYIKDLLIDSNNTGCWIYNIDNVDFYVPNYGYIVLFDSKFTDHKIPSLMSSKTIEHKYKINCSNIYDDNDPKKINQYEQMKDILSSNTFNHSFKLLGGTPPKLNIIEPIERIIHKHNKIKVDIFIESFPNFLNNKIGKSLTKLEVDKIALFSSKYVETLKVSDLVPYFTRFNEYVWCIITEIVQDSSGNYKIYGIKDINYNIEEITITNLKYYNDKVIPDQTVKGLKFDENYIFEKYYI